MASSADSSGGISPATQAMLEDMRRKMLGRRDHPEVAGSGASSAEQQRGDTAESLRAAIFSGRAVAVQRLEHPPVPHPAVAEHDSDPRRLFMMLRRRKRHNGPEPSGSSTSSPTKAAGEPPHGPPLEEDAWKTTSAAEAGPSPPPQPPSSGNRAGHPTARGSILQQRLVSSARPAAAKRPGSTLWDRGEAHGGGVPAMTHDGRPVTRQKHPKMALDLFPRTSASGGSGCVGAGGCGTGSVTPGGSHGAGAGAGCGAAGAGSGPGAGCGGGEVFPPRPHATRRSSAGPAHKAAAGSFSQPQHASSIGARNSGSRSERNSPQQGDPPSAKVDFNCLFFESGDDLDAHEEFPAARAQVEIPLIETDWFTSDAFELLPTTDGAEQLRDDDDYHGDDSPKYAESLYEMLVAQKRPRRPSGPV